MVGTIAEAEHGFGSRPWNLGNTAHLECLIQRISNQHPDENIEDLIEFANAGFPVGNLSPGQFLELCQGGSLIAK